MSSRTTKGAFLAAALAAGLAVAAVTGDGRTPGAADAARRAEAPSGEVEATPSGVAAQPLKVAVMELAVVDNSYGGDSDRLRAWIAEQGIDPTDLLRRAVGDASTYAALETRPTFVSIGAPRIERALREGDHAPADCYATECALAVGRALGADRVVTGEITKLSVLIWFVTGRVVDVRTGEVLRSEELEVKGVVTDLLPKVMVVLARRFASVPASAPAPVAGKASAGG